MNEILPNHQIVVVAAYLAGAAKSAVDTEDIAMKANEIAPGRFSWRKYPLQINIDTVRKRLWDACKREKGELLSGSERNGWLLTRAGINFAKQHIGSIAKESTRRVSLKERGWLRSERERLKGTDAYRKFSQKELVPITKREAETFFRIDDYVIGDSRTEKVSRITDAFSADVEIGVLVSRLAALVEENNVRPIHALRKKSRQ